ncbi:unnamed protein product, partial [Laminaria digitata]
EGTACEATEDCSLGNLCILGSCSTACIPGGNGCQDGTRCVEQTGDRCESNALTDDRRCSQGLFC